MQYTDAANQLDILCFPKETTMTPFTVYCEDQKVPYKYATQTERPQREGNGRDKESHGELGTQGAILELHIQYLLNV